MVVVVVGGKESVTYLTVTAWHWGEGERDL